MLTLLLFRFAQTARNHITANLSPRGSSRSIGFGYMRRRCTSKARYSSTTSFDRERDRPLRTSILRNR
jgi:hypothetical protein